MVGFRCDHTHQGVVSVVGADVVGGDLCMGQWRGDLSHYPTLV